MKRLLFVLVVVIGLALGWFIAQRPNASSHAAAKAPGDAPLDSADSALDATPLPAVRAAAHAATVEESSTTQAASDGSETAPNRFVRAQSSAGIELERVEVSQPNGSWREARVIEGRIDSGSFELPCTLRAPGHVATTIEKNARDVVLEPDALFVIHAKDLRVRFPDTKLTNVVGAAENERSLSASFVDKDHWAVAVSVLAPTNASQVDSRTDGTPRVLHFDLKSASGKSIVGDCTLRSGARTTWEADLGAPIEAEPLRVHLKPVAGERISAVKYELATIDSAEKGVVDVTQPWGSAKLPNLRAFQAARSSKVVNDSFGIDNVPIGVELTLSIVVGDNAAYGYARFVHDGSPRTIALQTEPIAR